MKNGLIRKGLVFTIIAMFIGVSALSCVSSKGRFTSDDTTPPVTTITFDPPVPNGLNGWYIIDVNVTLNATDDLSGVKTIYYQIPGEQWANHKGDYINFTLDQDCLIGENSFYSVDYTGNKETIKSASIDIDQLPSVIFLTYEVIGGNPWDGWEFLFTATATDDCSGMDRVEFFLNDVLQETVTGPGPQYSWSIILYPNAPPYLVRGLITNLKITDENVSFFAIIVMISESQISIDISAKACDIAGNCAEGEILSPNQLGRIIPGIYLFKNLTLPNNYQGHIGNFLIWAKFY